MTNIFETERLFAREYELDDAEEAFEIYGDPIVMEFIGPTRVATSVAQHRESILARQEKYRAFGKPFGVFALIEKATSKLVGTGLLKPLPDANEKNTEDVEIGWHLARKQWGRGFASEAGRALACLAFENLSIDVLNIVIHPGNERSIAVAKRLDATYKGRTTRYYGQELELFQLARNRWLTDDLDRKYGAPTEAMKREVDAQARRIFRR